MWDCKECGTTSIINDTFCPQCFATRPKEPAGEPVETAAEEVGEMAESDSKATDAADPTEVAPEAESPASDAGSASAASATTPSGPSEAVPRAGGFLTDWGR